MADFNVDVDFDLGPIERALAELPKEMVANLRKSLQKLPEGAISKEMADKLLKGFEKESKNTIKGVTQKIITDFRSNMGRAAQAASASGEAFGKAAMKGVAQGMQSEQQIIARVVTEAARQVAELQVQGRGISARGIINQAQIGQNTRLIEAETLRQREALVRSRQIDVADEQQSQRRKTERLRAFNNIFQQLTQFGLTRLRDARRSGDKQQEQDQKSSLKRQEINLQESYNVRKSIIEKQTRVQTEAIRTQNRQLTQEASSLSKIQQRTQFGVLGAARGATPGASLLGFGGIGALVGGGLGLRAIFNEAQDFQTALRKVGALTEATTEQMKQMQDASIALGKDLALPGVSAGDAANALAALAQTGFTVDQAIGAARGTLLLARTSMVDFGEAARFVGANVNAFGASAEDAVGFIDDVTVALAKGGGQNFSELQQAIEQAGSVFAATFKDLRGGTGAFQDMNEALAILARNALRGSDAGTSLRTFILRLTSPQSKDAAQLLNKMSKEIGLVGSFAFDAKGKVRPFIEIIKNLRDSTKDLNDEQRQKAFTEIFGQDAIRAANIFFNTTDAELEELGTAFDNSAGKAEDLASAVNKGLKGALDNLSSQISTIGIIIFKKLDEPLAAVVNTISKFIDTIVNGQGVFETLRVGLLGAAAALGGLVTFKGIAELIRNVLLPALSGLLTPMGLFVTAIGLLGAGFAIAYQKSQPFRDAIFSLGETVKNDLLQPLKVVGEVLLDDVLPAFATAGEAILGLFGVGGDASEALDTVGRSADSLEQTAKPALQGFADFITNTVGPAISSLGDFLTDDVVPGLQKAADFISGPVTRGIKNLPTLITAAKDELVALANLTTAAFGVAASAITDVALPAVEDFVENVQLGFSGEGFGAASTGFLGVLEEIGQKVGEVVRVISRLVTFDFGGFDFAGLGVTILRGLGEVARFVGRQVSAVFAEPVLRALAGALAAAGIVLGDVLVNLVIGFVEGMKGRVDDIARVLGDIFKLLFKAAFKLAFSGNTIVDVIVLGLTTAFGAALLGAGAGKILAPFRKFFLSGGFKTVARLLRFDLKGAIDNERNRGILAQEAKKVGVDQVRNLNRTRLGRLFIPLARNDIEALKQAKVNLQKVGEAVDQVATATTAPAGRFKRNMDKIKSSVRDAVTGAGGIRNLPLVVGVAVDRAGGKIGELVGKVFNVGQTADTMEKKVAVAMAGVAAAMSGQALAKAQDLGDTMFALTGIATSVAAGFAAGGPVGGAIAGLGAVAGFVFGKIQENARKTRERIDEMKEVFKESGAALEDFLGDAFDKVVEKSKKLRDAISQLGDVPIEIAVQENASEIAAAIENLQRLKDHRDALIDAAAQEHGVVADSVMDALNSQIENYSANLAAAMGITQEAAEEIIKQYKIIKQAALENLDIVAAKFKSNGDEAEQFFDDLKNAGNAKEINAAFRQLIPNEVEFILEDLGVSTDDLINKLKAGGPEFAQFVRNIHSLGVGAGLNEDQINDLVSVLRTLGITVTDVGDQIKKVPQIEIDQRRLDDLKDAWSKVKDATSKAKDAVGDYIAALRGAAAPGSVENFGVEITGQLREIQDMLTVTNEDGSTFLRDFGETIMAGSPELRDKLRIATQNIGQTFLKNLQDSIEGETDPAKINEAAQKFLARFREALDEVGITDKTEQDVLIGQLQLPDEVKAALAEQVKAQQLEAHVTELVVDQELKVPVTAVVGKIIFPATVVQREDATGKIAAPVGGGLARFREGGILSAAQAGIAHIYRDAIPRALFNEPETGGEAFIPLGPLRRTQSVNITRQVANMFGMELVQRGSREQQPLSNRNLQRFEAAITKLTNYDPPARVVIDQNIHEHGVTRRRTHRATVRALRNGSYLGWMH